MSSAVILSDDEIGLFQQSETRGTLVYFMNLSIADFKSSIAS